MKLKDINEIKEDGLVVFMPSGIQATLFNEGKNILVKYYNLKEDRYTIKDFKKIMDEGIHIFNKRPTTQVMESEEQEYELKIVTGRDRDSIGEIEDSSLRAKNDVDAFVQVLSNFSTCCSGYFNGEYMDDELSEEELEKIQKIKAAAETGENQEEAIALLADLYNDTMDISDYYDDIVEIIAPDGHVVFEDDIDLEGWEDDMDFEDDEDEEDDMDESILDKLSKKGFIRKSLKEAYENVKNPEGTVFKALKDKKKEYITPEFKLEMLNCLDQIAREYPDIKIRQQALTFMDEINMQEYWDTKAVQDFIKKPLEMLNAHVNESMEDIVTVIDIPLVTEKLYNKLVNTLYGNKQSKNRDYEQQQNVLNFLQEIEDRIPLGCEFHTDLEDYGFTIDEINAIKKIVRNERVNESLNEKYCTKAEITRFLKSHKATEVAFGRYISEIRGTEKLFEMHAHGSKKIAGTYDSFDLSVYPKGALYREELATGFGKVTTKYYIFGVEAENIDESLNKELEYGVEYRNMHDGIHRLLVTDSKEKAEQILAYLKELENPDTTVYDDNEIMDNAYFTWDEINKLADDCFEVDYREIEEGDGNYNGIYVINYNDIKPDIYESLNEYYYTNQDYEMDLKDNSKKLTKEADKLPYTDEKDDLDAIAHNVKKIAKQLDKDSDKFLDAAFEESLNEDENSMAEEIRRGNKSGEDPKFGNWLLETSLDEKWEQLTNDMKLYLMDGIADFVQQGSLKEQDLLLEIDPESGLTKEDIQSLEMFDQEEIDYTFSSEDLQLNAYISYEIKTDLDTPKDMEESLNEDEDSDLGLYIQTTGELYKKHIQDKKDVDWDALVNDGIAMYKKEIENKEFSPEEVEEAKEYLKGYFSESVDEAIYLKDKDGNEIGPFEDQEAEEQYIKDQKDNGNEEEYEEIIKDENMSTKNEDCYKVYSTIDPDSQPLSFNNWNEVEDHLNKEWGDYKASMAKENAEFGTDEDRDAFMGNFEVAIEPIEIPAEEIPAEGIELEAEPIIEPEAEVCPECGETECICGQEECEDCCPECGKNPCECEGEVIAVEPQIEEDFEDEHIGKSEEEPIEEPEEETEEEKEEEINTPEEAADKVDEIDDALDSLEDFLNTLIGDEELTDEEKAEIDALEEEPAEEVEEKNEEFSDNMGMLTDINDLDFPDALADAVDTKEDGSLYRISDLAKELEDVKSTIEQLKNDFKSELTTMLQDLKNDLKLSVNNVETKVQDTKSAVDNLTSEEEDLADIEFEQEEAPVEEEGQEEAPEEAPAEEESEEDMEEAFDEASLKGNPIYENIKTILASNTKCNGKMSIPTIAERLREDYGVNTKIGSVYNNVADICRKTSIKESLIDVIEEKQLLRESMLGKAAKWLGGGLMSRLEQQKTQAKYENIQAVKQQIDKEISDGADAEQLKDTITLASEDENEEKQAKDYAIQKLQQKTPTTESILSKLKATSKTAQLRDLNIRG